MNWSVFEPDPQLISKLKDELEIHPLLALLLLNRNVKNVKEAHNFLDAELTRLSDPRKLRGVVKAVERIRLAKQRKEKVFIFGDYDVDGITASALLQSRLKAIGLEVISYLPHRVQEGYGINSNAVNEAKKQGVGLFISVDCGITSFKQIKELRKLNIDSIIIDHHEPKEKGIPPANVIIDPKMNKDEARLRNLAAVGLVFKLLQALCESSLEEELDLVALGTICDVADINGENRILVKEGLKQINESKRPGIRALKQVAGIENKNISTGLVGFVLGPRLNAMGRIDSAHISFRLLTCSSDFEAKELAQNLNDTNRRRQKIGDKILQEALMQIEQEVNFKEHSVIVVDGEGWHPGVVGIVAAKLADKFCRPTLVLSSEDDLYRGSGRSVGNFHLLEALTECDALLKDYGGHQAAAGLTLRKEDLEEFKQLINRVVRERLKPEDLVASLNIDAQVPLFTWEDHSLVEAIEKFSPFGRGNPRPIFCSKDILLKSAPTRVGRNSLRFWVSDGRLTVKVIGFGMAEFAAVLGENSRIDLAYSVSIDTWQEPIVQLEIKDLKIKN